MSVINDLVVLSGLTLGLTSSLALDSNFYCGRYLG